MAQPLGTAAMRFIHNSTLADVTASPLLHLRPGFKLTVTVLSLLLKTGVVARDSDALMVTLLGPPNQYRGRYCNCWKSVTVVCEKYGDVA